MREPFLLAALLLSSACSAGRSISFTGMTGIITSPNFPDAYNDDQTIDYHIQVPDGYTVVVDLLIFQTEECCDLLYIFDGPTKDAPCIKKTLFLPIHISGNRTGLSVRSSGASLTAVFDTDLTTVMDGFFLRYHAVKENEDVVLVYGCPDMIRSEEYGIIMSPGYPFNYTNDMTCYYEMETKNGMVELTFYALNTEPCCDTIDIYDAELNETSRSKIEHLSGKVVNETTKPHVVRSQSPQILLVFSADLTNVFPGFSGKYRFIRQ